MGYKNLIVNREMKMRDLNHEIKKMKNRLRDLNHEMKKIKREIGNFNHEIKKREYGMRNLARGK